MITITACSYLTLGDPPTTPWVTPPPNNNQNYLRLQDNFKSSVTHFLSDPHNSKVKLEIKRLHEKKKKRNLGRKKTDGAVENAL